MEKIDDKTMALLTPMGDSDHAESAPPAEPSGLRVAALLRAVDAEHETALRAGASADDNEEPHDSSHADGRLSAISTVRNLIRAHLGEPTPAERAAAEVLALDVSEEGIDPEGDDYALRLVQRINAWMDSDDETIAGRRAALLECAAVAIDGILACDAKGGA